jgi:hypothetical protein
MKSISINGSMKTYHIGDWVEVGKHDAKQWVADGSAEILRTDIKTSTFDFADCGIVLTNGEYNPKRQAKIDIEIKKAPPFLQFSKTMLLDGNFKRINHNLIPIGFKMLDKFQICVPLHSYQELACNLGTEQEKKITQEIVHDLRCMVFEPRFMFVRRCPDMERLLKLFEKEKKRGKDVKLAFLRAMYQIKPLILHLPVTWIGVKW